jgi:hypothetical protein
MSITVTDAQKQNMVGLSTLILNAPPGSAFLSGLTQSMQGGATLSAIADLMFSRLLKSPELKGGTVIDAINLITTNLGLEKGSFGQKTVFNYIAQGLAKHRDIGALLVDVMNALKEPAGPDFSQAATQFQNKIAVGYAHTMKQGLYSTDLGSLRTAYFGVTDDVATVTQALTRLSQWNANGGALGLSATGGISIGSDDKAVYVFKLGQTLSVNVKFDSDVIVKGAPTLKINVGGVEKTAIYDSGSGTSTLVFNWIVDSGSMDDNGISFDANSLSLNGGSIKNVMGGKPSLQSAGLASDSRYTVDTTSIWAVDLDATAGVQSSAEISYSKASFAKGVSLAPNIQLPTFKDITSLHVTLGGEGLDATSGGDQLQLGSAQFGLDTDSEGTNITVGSIKGLDYSYKADTKTLTINLHGGAALKPSQVPVLAASIKMIAVDGSKGDRSVAVTFKDASGSESVAATEILNFDETVTGTVDFSTDPGAQLVGYVSYDKAQFARGVLLLPDLQVPTSPDIGKLVMTLGGAGLDARQGADQLILDNTVGLNKDVSATNVVVGGVNGINYTYTTSNHTLVIGHNDGTALTGDEISKLASAIKLITESSNHGVRTVSLTYQDVSGNLGASGGEIISFNDPGHLQVDASGILSITSSFAGNGQLFNLASGSTVGSAVSLVADTPTKLSVAAQAVVTYLEGMVTDASGSQSMLSETLILGTTGSDSIYGTSGVDIIYGFGGSNTIKAGQGADTIVSDSGVADTFVYDRLADSLAGDGFLTAGDTIVNFKHLEDHFKVGASHVSAIQSSGGLLSGGSYAAASTGDLGHDISAALLSGGGSLIANGAAVVTITGDAQESGRYLVINDAYAGYNAGADAVIKLVGAVDIPTASDFIV